MALAVPVLSSAACYVAGHWRSQCYPLLLDAAESLNDLQVPPGNRLEKLHGDREGQHSIRINDQWRICFRWEASDAFEVEITDYH